MNYMDVDPCLVKERRKQMLGELHPLRLHKRLRDKGASSGSHIFALVRRCALPSVRSRNRGGASEVALRH